MPYSSDHRLETKGKIIKSARRLFNRHGFDSVTIEQVMENAGFDVWRFLPGISPARAIYMPKS